MDHANVTPGAPMPGPQLIHSNADVRPPTRSSERLRQLVRQAANQPETVPARLSPEDQRIIVAFADFILLATAAPFAAWLTGCTFAPVMILLVGSVAAMAAVAFRAALCWGMVGQRPRRTSVLGAVSATAMAIAATVFGWLVFESLPEAGLRWSATWVGLAMACTLTVRAGARLLQGPSSDDVSPVILGDRANAQRIAAILKADGKSGWEVQAILRDDLEADLNLLRALVDQRRTQLILLAIPLHDKARIQLARDTLIDVPVRVCVVVDPDAMPDMAAGGQPAGLHLLEILPDPLGGRRAVIKRSIDLLAVFALIPLIAPVLLAVVLAIRLNSPGPILFSQLRFGRNSRLTRVWKFRTMYWNQGDATGAKRTLARDPRVTSVGRILRRTSIDELPQLWNVLTGEMSLVGPRPHAAHMKINDVYYFDAVGRYAKRHRVTPGITGWAQINGSRGEVDTIAKAERRVELDLWYIENWSPLLDIKILGRTAFGGFASPRAD